MSERVVWLDGMKGLGILLVMLSHFCHVPFLLIAGYMPLFFFASGITYKPSTSFKLTAEKKGKRLLIPWLFYGFIIFATDILYSIFAQKFSWHLFSERLTGLAYMRSSFLWPYDLHTQGNLLSSNGPMWFLPTMFLVCLYMVLYERCKRKWLFVVGLIVLTVATYKIPIQFPWGMELALMGILFLMAAIPMCKYIALRKDSLGGGIFAFGMPDIIYVICSSWCLQWKGGYDVSRLWRTRIFECTTFLCLWASLFDSGHDILYHSRKDKTHECSGLSWQEFFEAIMYPLLHPRIFHSCIMAYSTIFGRVARTAYGYRIHRGGCIYKCTYTNVY